VYTAFGVLGIWFNEQIDVFGRPRLRVERHRVAAYYRYLTFWELKMDKSSFKSSNIWSLSLHLVSRKCDFDNGAHAFVDWKLLPIPILIGLHGIET
jgi:hypothetical protein